MPSAGQVVGGAAILGGVGLGAYALTHQKPTASTGSIHGAPGSPGSRGAKGAHGAHGATGKRGAHGARGARGARGPAGVTQIITRYVTVPGARPRPPAPRPGAAPRPVSRPIWPYRVTRLHVDVLSGTGIAEPAAPGIRASIVLNLGWSPLLSAAAARHGVARLIVAQVAPVRRGIVQQGPWRAVPSQYTFAWTPRQVGSFTLLLEVRNPLTGRVVKTWRGRLAVSTKGILGILPNTA